MPGPRLQHLQFSRKRNFASWKPPCQHAVNAGFTTGQHAERGRHGRLRSGAQQRVEGGINQGDRLDLPEKTAAGRCIGQYQRQLAAAGVYDNHRFTQCVENVIG